MLKTDDELWSEYCDLIAQLNPDEKELTHLMVRLGLSAEQVRGDIAARRRAPQLEAVIAGTSALAKRNAEFADRIRDFEVRRREVLDALDAEQAGLLQAQAALSLDRSPIDAAHQELNRLKRLHRAAFRLPRLVQRV